MAQSISSRENDKIKQYIKLRDTNAHRALERRFTAEGIKLCMDIAVISVPLQVFYTQSALEMSPRIALLGGEHYIISESVSAKLSELKSPQGLFCIFNMPSLSADLITQGSYVMLENVQDPANVGAIVRSAAAFGYKGAILSEGCACVYCGKALRASMGAAMRIDIIEGCDMPTAAKALRAQGARIYAACLQDSVPLTQIDIGGKVGIMIGNEGKGLSNEAIAACDTSVRIPISGKTESLNAAAAASVLLWHFKDGDALWE